MEALMQRVGKKVPKNFYNCLCGFVSSSAYYEKGRCVRIGPLGGHEYYAIPRDSETWGSCISRVKYDDNSTIVDVVEKSVENPRGSNLADVDIPLEPKVEVFEPCYNAVVHKEWLKKLNNMRWDVESQIGQLKKEREKNADLRDKIYDKVRQTSFIAHYLEELARQDRENLQAALNTCVELREAAIRKAMKEFSSKFSTYMSEQKNRNKQALSKRLAIRRQMMSDNKAKLEKLDKKYTQLKQKIDGWAAGTPKESKKLYKDFKSLGVNRQALKNKIEASEKVIKLVDNGLKMPDISPGGRMVKIEDFKDAIIGQYKVKANDEDKNLAARNDHAQRVAEQLFLGMDRRIAESMNAELILSELSPIIKAERLAGRIETYTTMLEKNAEALPNTIAKQIPETREYALNVQNFDIQIKQYYKKIKTIKELYEKGWESYRDRSKKCIEMTKSGKSLGYKAMYKIWKKRQNREGK